MLVYNGGLVFFSILVGSSVLPVLTKSPAGKLSLDDICTLKNDNRVIDCANINFIGKKAGVKVTVDTCIHPTKVTLEMIVKALGINWIHDFTSGQEFVVPGFEYAIPGISGKVVAKIYLIKHSNNKMNVKVLLMVRLTLGASPIKLPKIKIYDGFLNIRENCNISFWKKLPTGQKAGLIAGCILAFIALCVLVILLIHKMIGPKSRVPRTSIKSWKIDNNLDKKEKSLVLKHVTVFENLQFTADQQYSIRKK